MKKSNLLPIVLVILVVLVTAFSVISSFNQTEDAIVEGANSFISALDDAQKKMALIDFEHDTRTIWHFLPEASFNRTGIALSELSDVQDKLVFNLLSASLSAEGYEKTQKIVDLENILKVLEKDNATRDPEQYHVAIYGQPAIKGTWGYTFQGHHVALNYTFVDGKLSTAPTFLGANPGEVPSGPKKGLRVLKDEEDLGLKLINALTPDQQAKAMISDVAPREIFTANESEVSPLKEVGVSYKNMSAENKKTLDLLISEYISVMPEEVAKRRVAKLANAGLDDIRFAWAGPKDRSAGHYYRIQGPTFLVEFDNTQNDANHIHTVWRDFNGDFGRDIIREHYHKAGDQHGHD